MWSCSVQTEESSGRRVDDDRTALTTPAIRIEDAAGHELVLERPARRVISLVPSATEMLRAMGAAAVLVGRTDFDSGPWTSGLPSVGGGIEPDLEVIAALSPDLVVRFAGEQDPRTWRRLDGLGIPHLAVRPDRVADIYRSAELLGVATGRTSSAAALVASIRDGLAGLAAQTRRLPIVRTAYVLGGQAPWVAGPGTYIDEIIALAGGQNVFSDLGTGYAAVSPEQLRARQIDVILLSAQGTYDRTLTPGARVEIVDEAIEIPGPRVVEAALHVAELLHGKSLR